MKLVIGFKKVTSGIRKADGAMQESEHYENTQ